MQIGLYSLMESSIKFISADVQGRQCGECEATWIDVCVLDEAPLSAIPQDAQGVIARKYTSWTGLHYTKPAQQYGGDWLPTRAYQNEQDAKLYLGKVRDTTPQIIDAVQHSKNTRQYHATLVEYRADHPRGHDRVIAAVGERNKKLINELREQAQRVICHKCAAKHIAEQGTWLGDVAYQLYKFEESRLNAYAPGVGQVEQSYNGDEDDGLFIVESVDRESRVKIRPSEEDHPVAVYQRRDWVSIQNRSRKRGPHTLKLSRWNGEWAEVGYEGGIDILLKPGNKPEGAKSAEAEQLASY